MGWAVAGWEGRGSNSTVLDFHDSESMFNTGPAFQRGFSSADAKGGIMMLSPCMLPKATPNGVLSLRQSRSWKCKQTVWSKAAVAFTVLGSSEACALEARGGMLVLESIQQRAFGFLHLTRSPRHGMHSSARQRAFGMPEKQQLVRATDAERGHDLLFFCFEWRPWRHNSKEPLGGQMTRRRPRAPCSVLGLLSSQSDIFSGRRESARAAMKGWNLQIKAVSGLRKQTFGHTNDHLRETSMCLGQSRLPGEGLHGFCWWCRHLRFPWRAELPGYQNRASSKRCVR